VSRPPSEETEEAGSQGPPKPAGNIRLITRYANRKLYDTGSRELTSLRRIEELVRAGHDIKVVDHDTSADMTAEVLVSVLSNSIAEQDSTDGIAALLSLIRSPHDVLRSLAADRQRVADLRGLTKRVRLLSATLEALLSGTSEPPPEPGDVVTGHGGAA